MDDTDALELLGVEDFVIALLTGGPFVVPNAADGPSADANLTRTSDAAVDELDASRES